MHKIKIDSFNGQRKKLFLLFKSWEKTEFMLNIYKKNLPIRNSLCDY